MGGLDMARVSRATGGTCAIVIATLGIYLPIAGTLPPALLPFLVALGTFCIGDLIAILIEDRRAGGRVFRSRSHLLR